MNNEYKHIAVIYRHLMETVDYEDWADYISEICEGHQLYPKIVLELASGAGELAEHLTKFFPKIITTDLSYAMLHQMSGKKKNPVCCDMTNLPFKEKFPLIISTFDSINYLTSTEQVEKLFRGVRNILSDEGIFTFDVSLESNSINNEKFLNRAGEFKNIKYNQKSVYDKNEKVHYNYFNLELADGTLFEEIHKQKIYDFNYYFEVINECGLFVSECFEAFSFEDANKDSERVQFIVKNNGR